ncbi:hypothetical protein [Pseudomonas aeruginosa]|uniref:hypothetical protein n=1 Tax=Pseudomonas aeruginosa TaxID=287 RepID=UPI0010509E63|nr:hypothetical protein [Pseudomonas aeruginosa]
MRAIIKAIQELINPSEEDLVSIKMRKIEVLKFENTLCEEILDATYKTMSDNLDAIKRIEAEIESITGVKSEERPAVGERIIYRQEKIIEKEIPRLKTNSINNN